MRFSYRLFAPFAILACAYPIHSQTVPLGPTTLRLDHADVFVQPVQGLTSPTFTIPAISGNAVSTTITSATGAVTVRLDLPSASFTNATVSGTFLQLQPSAVIQYSVTGLGGVGVMVGSNDAPSFSNCAQRSTPIPSATCTLSSLTIKPDNGVNYALIAA